MKELFKIIRPAIGFINDVLIICVGVALILLTIFTMGSK
jgi:hypothetical protein